MKVQASDYHRVGLALLAEAGIEGVTLAAVCQRLEITKGSFYNYFSGIDELHHQMLALWADIFGRQRVEAIQDLPPLDRLEATLAFAVDRDHAVEVAVRAWGRTDPHAAIVQHRLDETRLRFLQQTYEDLGLNPTRSRVFAEMGLALLIGIQARQRPVDPNLLQSVAHEWSGLIHVAIWNEQQQVAFQHEGNV